MGDISVQSGGFWNLAGMLILYFNMHSHMALEAKLSFIGEK